MIFEEGTCTNIIEPTPDNQFDGNLGSTSNPLNKQSLPVVVQPLGDMDLIKDYLQEQSLQLVDYKVYSSVAIMMNYTEEFQVWDPGDSGHDNIHIRVAQWKFDGTLVLQRIDAISLILPARLIWDPRVVGVSSDDGLLEGKQSLDSEDLSCPQIWM